MKQVLKYTAIVGSTMLVAGSCGIALGASGEPAERVVTRTVEVKGPTETKTVTKEVEVAVTPQACLDALVASEDIADNIGSFVDVASRYPLMVADAYQAGVLNDSTSAQDVLTRMRDARKDINGINGELLPLVDDFNRYKEECRASE